MSVLSRPSLRIALLAFLALGATLLTARAAWACEAYDVYDNPRPCTFLEEYGECLVSALDAHEQCMERKESLLDAVRCHTGTQVDLLVCNLGMPLDFIGKVLNPFDDD